MNDGRGTADSHQTKYRPDLDGLRAVAVLSVIAYHISTKILPGGYLGVDMFFVLSGYLITSIIWGEAISQTFSIGRFYERRIRRIMPALLTVLMVASGFAIAFLLPLDLKGYSKSLLAGLSFVANIYFWRDTGYFSQLADEKPLLHLWSLGVEEQFYIAFPILVILCFRLRRSILFPLTAAFVMLSFGLNVLAIRADHDQLAFYLIPTRAWELGAGCLLALASPKTVMHHRGLHTVLEAAAAILLIASLCFDESPLGRVVPSAFWVVLGTTLAIYIGTNRRSRLTRALAFTPLVWIGLISYSLYLWHWPILVFVRYYLTERSLTLAQAAIVVSLMFVCAVLSWRFIERPFRDRSLRITTVLTWVGMGSAIVSILSVTTLLYNGFPSRFREDSSRINSAVGTTFRCAFNQTIPFGAGSACPLSLPSRDPANATVAFIGNSHAQMYAPLVTRILRENHQEGILVSPPACQPMPEFEQSTTCMATAAENLEAVEGLPKVRVVILATTWPGYFSESDSTPAGLIVQSSSSENFLHSLDKLIEGLELRGKAVILIGPISPPGWESASIVARQLAFGRKIDEPLFLPESAFMKRQGTSIEHYAHRSDIVFIRPDQVQCQQERCDYFRDGASLFADYSHIAEAALPLFNSTFESGLSKAFESPTRLTN